MASNTAKAWVRQAFRDYVIAGIDPCDYARLMNAIWEVIDAEVARAVATERRRHVGRRKRTKPEGAR